MFDLPERMLVVAPHCLDEVLGVGGTVRRAADAGVVVDVLVLFGDGQGRDLERRKAARAAADVLKVRSLRFAGFPENLSDTVPMVELVGAVEESIRNSGAQAVFTSHGGSLHIDHSNTSRATLTAARPVPGSTVRALYAYEIQSSTDWNPTANSAFTPTWFVDISAVLAVKLEALAIYGDEMRPPPHARSIASAEQLALVRGAVIGRDAAEAFSLLRGIA